MSNHTILLNITWYWVIFITIFVNIQWIFQYYSILHVILSNTHFNIILHIGEYWFQYYLMLPEQLGDAGGGGGGPGSVADPDARAAGSLVTVTVAAQACLTASHW